MKKYIIFLFLLTVNYVYGQNQVHSKITILAGGSVVFPFNSYTKMHDGMEYTNWTRLKISYLDTLDIDGSLTPGSKWSLRVKATTNDIPGDGAVNMNIDKVQLQVVLTTDDGTISNDAATYFTIAAGSANTTIVSNGQNPTGRDGPVPAERRDTEVLISYRVGNDGTGPPAANSILGEAPGYYYVDLIFTLEKGP